MTIARVVLSSLLVVLGAVPVLAQAAGGPGSNGGPALKPADGPAGVDYRLVTGDKLRIEVYKEPQLSQSLQIRPDGKISLPLIGDVLAAGVTPRELTDTITGRLREFVMAPAVTIIVAETNPPVIYVMGEVNTPGAKPMPTPITVVQALALAGGFKEFANPKKIRILRKGPGDAVKTIDFNYRKAVGRAEQPTFLQPGDTVIVP